MRQLFVHKVSISTSRRAAALPFIGYKVVCTLFLKKKFLYIYKKKLRFFSSPPSFLVSRDLVIPIWVYIKEKISRVLTF